jgi:hypothetical protein
MKMHETRKSIPFSSLSASNGVTASILCPCGCGIMTAVILNAGPGGSSAVNVSLITLAHPEAYYTEKARKMRGERT